MPKKLKELYGTRAELKKQGVKAAEDHGAKWAALQTAQSSLRALSEEASEEDVKKARKAVDEASNALQVAADKVNETADALEDVEAEISVQETQSRAGRAFRNAGAAAAMAAALTVTAGAAARVHDPNPETTAGFKSIAEMALAVKVAAYNPAQVDERLRPAAATDADSALSSGGDNGEGFALPSAFRAEIWDLVTEDPFDFFNMADGEPTSSESIELAADESTPWGASGVVAKWRADKSKMEASGIDEEGRTVKLNELYAFVLASENLLADRPRLQNRLTTKAAEALRWELNRVGMRGEGVGQPLGFLNSKALITVAKEGSQAADTLLVTNIVKMYSRMLPSSLGRAVWFANPDILPALLTLTIGDRPVYMPPSGLASAPFGTILGRPVIFTEHAGTIGDMGDISFVDPRGYFMPRRSSSPQFAESMHLYFDQGVRAFRWTIRVGGQPYLSKPVSPPAQTNAETRSHFVTLAERAD